MPWQIIQKEGKTCERLLILLHHWLRRTFPVDVGVTAAVELSESIINSKNEKDGLKSVTNNLKCRIHKSIYIPWPFPPVWGVANNTKETTKTMGVLFCSSSNDEGPSRVWMALLEQHSPPSPVFHNLRHFKDASSPTAPITGLPLRQPRGNSRCQSKLRHNHSPLIPFLVRSLASLKSILLSFRALFTLSIHPNLGLPLALLPSTFAFITFFSSRSLSILSTWQNHLKTFISTLAANSLLTPVLALTTSFLTLSNWDTPVEYTNKGWKW